MLGALFAAGGKALSPEELARLGLARNKAESTLRPYCEAGYPLRFHPDGGISLGPSPDIWCAEEILGRCHGVASPGPAWDPVLLRETGSTNDVAREQARRGAREGLVVAASRQTRGRGRLGRSWESAQEGGLYASLLLRPNVAAIEAGQLGLLSSVAAADAVESTAGLRPQVKWPNDLLLEGRKLGGLLIETETQGGRIAFAVVGVGLNVRQRAEDFSPAVRDLATSLYLATGRLYRRADLLVAFLAAMAGRLRQPSGEVREAWAASSLTLGRQVTLQTARGPLRGQAMGLDESGALLLRTASGEIEAVSAGDMHAV